MSRRTHYLRPDLYRRTCAGRRPLSGGLWQVDQPEQPRQPPPRDAEQRRSREEVLDKLRKEMQPAHEAKSIPLYSLLADKAQKAAIAFTPQQLMMVMGGLLLWRLSA